MAGEVARDANQKGKIVKDTHVPSDKQLDAVWDNAPGFFGKEMVSLVVAREEMNKFQGPLVKSGFPLVDFFNAADQKSQPNEQKELDLTDPKNGIGTGHLVLQWDDRATPSRLTFTNKAGDVEEVALDSINPTQVSFDMLRKKDGTVARYNYDLRGEVLSGSLSKGKDRDQFDFNYGFHVRSDYAGSRFALTDDSNQRFIETTVRPPKGRRRPTDIATLKYVYANHGEQDDGELNAVVLNLANGATYRVYPDEDGKWIRQNLANPGSR